jgi:hypothetical protein
MEAHMALTIQIPDEVLETYRDVLPPPQLGVLEAVAVDAVLGILEQIKAGAEARFGDYA